MALKIKRKTISNVDADYARISRIENKDIFNGASDERQTVIWIEWWLDEATRDLAKTGGDQKSIEINKYEAKESFSDVTSAYIYLKTLPDFKGAKDC